MGRRMFDFECSLGHVHEALVDSEAREHECPQCQQPAQRKIAAPRPQLEGFSGAFPTAADQWVKRRESHMAKERKNMRNHGTYK